MLDIAFITTCKGRLEHIRQTLPTLVSEGPRELIVVDYGCPEGVGDWVESRYPLATVVRVTDDPGFCVSRARNFGGQQATAEWLCFIDGDVSIRPGFVEWCTRHLDGRCFYRAAPVNGSRDPETWGTILCRRDRFLAVGGYDEAFRGWGGEDDDLFLRLGLAGSVESDYPAEFVDVIRHDDATRTTYYDVKQKGQQWFCNQFYTQAKIDLMKIIGRPLPLEERIGLMQNVADAVSQWRKDGASTPFAFTTTFAMDAWLPPPHRMTRQYHFTYGTQA